MKTKKTPKKNPRRFYISRTAVRSSMCLRTFEQAKKDAVSAVENSNTAEPIYIVEVVKVVQPVKPPVDVFDFMLE